MLYVIRDVTILSAGKVNDIPKRPLNQAKTLWDKYPISQFDLDNRYDAAIIETELASGLVSSAGSLR